VAAGIRYWYRVTANGPPVGDVLTANFPTMSADSVSNVIDVQVGSAPNAGPLAPTNLVATPMSGPRVGLTWRDNATDETGFVIERCTVVTPPSCTAFAQIAAPGPKTSTGNVSYTDSTVAFGASYLYRVKAFNATGDSAYVTLASAVLVPAIPAAPTAFTVSVVKAGANYTATLTWTAAANPTTFTIQRAGNATFTSSLNTSTAAGTARTATQTLKANTTYYFRIRANNSIGGFSAWKTALPLPIRTGP
jgi:hypothetical protein